MKTFIMLVTFTLVFTFNAQTFTDGTPEMDLRIENIEIRSVNEFRSEGAPTLGGAFAVPGPYNFNTDAYTAPTWATGTESYFTMEQYSFPTTHSFIDHRIVAINNQGPWPTLFSFAFAWQICHNPRIYPPVPVTVGTNLPWDGATMGVTLPYPDIWYITAGISGFSTGTWDWIWLGRYDGVTPIPVIPPGVPGNDIVGGSLRTNSLYTSTDDIGDGEGSGRPWCFKVVAP
jgi:hypothetical protein